MRAVTCAIVVALIAGCATKPAEHKPKLVYVPQINENSPTIADLAFCDMLFIYLSELMNSVRERDMFMSFAKLSASKLAGIGGTHESPEFNEGLDRAEAFLSIASHDERDAAMNSCIKATLGTTHQGIPQQSVRASDDDIRFMSFCGQLFTFIGKISPTEKEEAEKLSHATGVKLSEMGAHVGEKVVRDGMDEAWAFIQKATTEDYEKTLGSCISKIPRPLTPPPDR